MAENQETKVPLKVLESRIRSLYGHTDGRMACDYDLSSGQIVDAELHEVQELFGEWFDEWDLSLHKITARDAVGLYHFAVGCFRFFGEVQELGPRICLELAKLGPPYIESLDADLTIEIPSTGRRVSLWDIELHDLIAALPELRPLADELMDRAFDELMAGSDRGREGESKHKTPGGSA